MSGLPLDLALGTDERSRDDLTQIVLRAEHAGVRGAWFTEAVGRDVFTVLTSIALATERVELGTGIVNVFARTPTMIAQSAASVLEVMAGRRFNLGLGTSGKRLIENAYGVAFDRPVTRLAETVRVVDTIFRQATTPEPMTVMRTRSFPFGLAAERDRLRIFVAGLGPRSLRVTGELGDGWLPIWPSARHFGRLRSELDGYAIDAQRPLPVVAAYVYGAVGASGKDRRAVRDTLAWYVAANGTAYRRLFERYGYGEVVGGVAELWAAGRRDDARAAVPDTLLDDTALLGSAQNVLEQVRRLETSGVDRVVWRVPRQLPTPDVLAMIDDLAAAAAG